MKPKSSPCLPVHTHQVAKWGGVLLLRETQNGGPALEKGGAALEKGGAALRDTAPLWKMMRQFVFLALTVTS